MSNPQHNHYQNWQPGYDFPPPQHQGMAPPTAPPMLPQQICMTRGRGRGMIVHGPHAQQQCRGNNRQWGQHQQSSNQDNYQAQNQMNSNCSSESAENLKITVPQEPGSSRSVEGQRNRSKSREDQWRGNYSEHKTEPQGRASGQNDKRERSRSRDKKSRWDNPQQDTYYNNNIRSQGASYPPDRGHQGHRRYGGHHQDYDQGNYQGYHQGNPYADNRGGYYNRQGSRSGEDSDMFLSKTLSSILRHNAKKFGLELDKGGFLYVSDILYKMHKLRGYQLEDIQRVVESNDKKRFSMEQDGQGKWKIRANQGHTVEVEELALTPITSANDYPHVIHGTYYEAWGMIKETGLKRMNRNHIHFAADMPGSSGVISGMRKSCEVVIYIDLEKALKAGLQFFVSANNVILSTGDETGTIYPCFFLGAKERKTGYRLDFDTTIDGSRVAREDTDPKKKRKKNKGKGKQVDHDEEDTTADQPQQQSNKKPKNSKDSREHNPPENKDSVARKSSVDEGMEKPNGVDEPDVSESTTGLEAGNKDTADVSAADSAFETSMSDSTHERSDCSALHENDDSMLAQGNRESKTEEEDSPRENWDDDDEPEEKVTKSNDAEPVANSSKNPEWNDPTLIEHPEASASFVDSLQNSKAIAICCAGEDLGTVNGKISLIVVLGEPHIGVYKMDEDGARLMKEGNLRQLFTNSVPKVFNNIKKTSFSLINEYDILLDGVPIWDVKMMYEMVGDHKSVGEELLGLNAWEKIQRWETEDDSFDFDSQVTNLVTRGKMLLHLYSLLHGLIENDDSKKREFKKEIFSKAIPSETALDDKISKLKLEKKEKKAEETKQQKQQQQEQQQKQSKQKQKQQQQKQPKQQQQSKSRKKRH